MKENFEKNHHSEQQEEQLLPSSFSTSEKDNTSKNNSFLDNCNNVKIRKRTKKNLLLQYKQIEVGREEIDAIFDILFEAVIIN